MIIFIAFIAMTVPVLGFVLTLAYFNQYKRALASALLCGLAFSAAIYGYIPDDGNDIFRHMANLSFYEGIPLWDAFDLLKTSTSHISTVYTWDLWLWIVAQFDNPILLQSSGALVGYCIISYLIFFQAKKNGLSMGQWLPVYFIALVCFPPLEIAIGIRSACAFLLCILAIYSYYTKKIKKVTVAFLMGIAVFLHHAALIFLILWGMSPLFFKHKKIVMVCVVLCMIAFNDFQSYLSFFYGGTTVFSNLLGNTMYSAAAYSEEGFNDSFHALVSLVLRWGFSGFLLLIIRRGLDQQGKINNQETESYQLLNFALLLFVVASTLLVIIGNNGLRYLGAVDILCCLSLMDVLAINNISMWFKNGKLGLWQLSLLIGAVMQGSLYLYDMSWGTASLSSFFSSSLLGYFSKILLSL